MDHYKASGVDTAKGDALVDWLQSSEKQPKQHRLGEVVSGIGGFAALFRPKLSHIEDPILVSGTDGVGTKVLLGLEHQKIDGLGIDLVAMCANDVITVGAKPLFFLDYYATGRLEDEAFKQILQGIRRGCAQADALLIGGETAELPGLYARGHFDLAGFCVGMVDGKKMLKPELVRDDDVLIALPSSGFHSNGYSLIRKWLDSSAALKQDQALIQNLLTPTKIYGQIPELLQTLPPQSVHALAHITGGGISGNLPRVFPEHLAARIDRQSIPTPQWMRAFIELHTSLSEVEPVFNLGVGMIAVVAKSAVSLFMHAAHQHGLEPTCIGTMQKRKNLEVEYV